MDPDIHTETAAEIFEVPVAEVTGKMRRLAKEINFGVIYGLRPSLGTAKRLGIDQQEKDKSVNDFVKQFPGIKKLLRRTK